MDRLKLLAITLIALGTLGLVYGGFSYTSARHRADIGGLHVDLDEHQWFTIPLWAGIAGVAGGALLLARRRS
jgi:hypothetical protein